VTAGRRPLLRLIPRVPAGVAGVAGAALLALAAIWLAVNAAENPSNFLTVVLIGITNGSIYGLIALGYTLVYGVLELINFAHGDVFMLGGMLTATIAVGTLGLAAGESLVILLPAVLLMLVLAAAFCAAINAGVELIAYRRLRGGPRLAPLITAVGVSFILQNIGLIWKGPVSVSLPDILPQGAVIDVGGVVYTWDKLIVLLVTVPVLLGLIALVQRTRQGKAMRATAQDMDAAAMLGVNVDRTISFTFALAGALAGVAGLLFALYVTNIRFDTGFQLGLIAFTAAVLGGIGNLTGAVVGSLVIGLVQACNDGFTWMTPGSDWTQSIVFSILILILVLRPEGLLGERETVR
jgi:branched-chain amino acid transport system permease protein